MEFIKGVDKILFFKIDEDYLPIGCLTVNSFSESSTMLSTTTRDNPNGWTTSRPTSQSYNIPFSGLVTKDYYQTTKVTYNQIRSLKRERTLIDWRVSTGDGNFDYGCAFLQSVSDEATVGENVSFSGDLIGFGEPINEFDRILFEYKEFVESQSGELSSFKCTKLFIERLITG